MLHLNGKNSNRHQSARFRVTGIIAFSVVLANAAISFAGQSTDSMELKEAQEKLKTLGYNLGDADGKLGPRTTAALLLYQKKTGLDMSGVLDKATSESLGIGKKKSIGPSSRESVGKVWASEKKFDIEGKNISLRVRGWYAFGMLEGADLGKEKWDLVSNVLVKKGEFSDSYYILDSDGHYVPGYTRGRTLEIELIDSNANIGLASSFSVIVIKSASEESISPPALVDSSRGVAHIIVPAGWIGSKVRVRIKSDVGVFDTDQFSVPSF